MADHVQLIGGGNYTNIADSIGGSGSDLDEMDVWYANPMYVCYWQHYRQAINWHQRHKQTYIKALEVGNLQSPCAVYSSAVQFCSDLHANESWLERNGDRVKEDKQEIIDLDSKTEESLDESHVQYNFSNVDISDEMRQYFAQTEQHKQNLKKQQTEQQDSDQGLHRVSWRSIIHPSERLGESRTAEMKKLYGKDAAKIQGMETAIQLSFDRYFDRKHPSYWPVIPLKL